MSLVLRHGQAFSPIYRFSLSDGTIVSAHTKSKLVRSPATNEPQLYMSLHILQRYVSLPTAVSGRGKQIRSINLITCFSLLVPCSTSSCPCVLCGSVNVMSVLLVVLFWVGGLVCSRIQELYMIIFLYVITAT